MTWNIEHLEELYRSWRNMRDNKLIVDGKKWTIIDVSLTTGTSENCLVLRLVDTDREYHTITFDAEQ